MAPTLAEVVDLPELDLEVLTGEAATNKEVRWAHVIELRDPTPWLRGGELVLTTGIALPGDARSQHRYVRKLADCGCVALGFAEEQRTLPEAVLHAARDCGLPLIAVRGTTPFIAVVEAIAQWHAQERLRLEQHVIEVQERAARAALRSGPSGILRELAQALDGETMLVDAHGHTTHIDPDIPRTWHEDVTARITRSMSNAQNSMAIHDQDGQVLVHSLGLSGRPIGWLAAWADSAHEHQQRMLTSHAAALVSIEILGMRSARVRWHEQRAAVFTAYLDEQLGADLTSDQLRTWCDLPPPPYEVVCVTSADSPAADDAVREALTELAGLVENERALVCPTEQGMVLVLPESTPRTGRELLNRARQQLDRDLRAGACRADRVDQLRRAVDWASDLAATRAQHYTHASDVGAWTLLRDSVDPEGLRRFCDAVLEPLRAHDQRNNTALVATARVFLDAAGSMDRAAATLAVHRNTLRSRLRSIERITGRPLTDTDHRNELWLALALPDLLPPGTARGSV